MVNHLYDKQQPQPRRKWVEAERLPEIEITNTIPIPARPYSLDKGNYWKFDQMKVGESFKVPAGREQKCRSAACVWARRNGGVQFAVRKYPDNDGTYTHRCWRVK